MYADLKISLRSDFLELLGAVWFMVFYKIAPIQTAKTSTRKSFWDILLCSWLSNYCWQETREHLFLFSLGSIKFSFTCFRWLKLIMLVITVWGSVLSSFIGFSLHTRYCTFLLVSFANSRYLIWPGTLIEEEEKWKGFYHVFFADWLEHNSNFNKRNHDPCSDFCTRFKQICYIGVWSAVDETFCMLCCNSTPHKVSYYEMKL